MALFMRPCRCRIGNEQESKGGFGFVGTAAGTNTDGATAACAKQPSLGQADGVSLGREVSSPSALSPECRVGDWCL